MSDLVRKSGLPPTKHKYTYNIWNEVPDSGELLIYRHHTFSKTGTASTHSESGMVAYQGGVCVALFYHTDIWHVCLLLCMIDPILGNRYGPGDSSCDDDDCLYYFQK